MNHGPDNIRNAYEYGVFPRGRHIGIVGDVTERMLLYFQTGLWLLDGSDKPITVYLTSNGGDIYAGLGIYDAIKACTSPVRVVGRGYICSMATAILQAGDERILEPNCTVMAHQARSASDYVLVQNLTRTAAEYERSNDVMCNLIASRMGISLKQFKTRFLLDTYFTAERAVAEGLADQVAGRN
jgi:ATP-dependent Clp protease protease subunit